MRRIMFKSKIHRATITEANLNYEGSISIDSDLMEAANIKEYEQVSVVNINNGERLETYAIKAPAGSKQICLNGAGARKGMVGDRIIIMTYTMTEHDLQYTPVVVVVDENNNIVSNGDAKTKSNANKNVCPRCNSGRPLRDISKNDRISYFSSIIYDLTGTVPYGILQESYKYPKGTTVLLCDHERYHFAEFIDMRIHITGWQVMIEFSSILESERYTKVIDEYWDRGIITTYLKDIIQQLKIGTPFRSMGFESQIPVCHCKYNHLC